MFLFGPLHVLILYGFKRVSGILDRDEAVFEEIQKRAAKVPPAQRQAAIELHGDRKSTRLNSSH